MKKKILIFNPYTYWEYHANYEIASYHNLESLGHQLIYVNCDITFEYCDLFWLNITGPKPPEACENCRNTTKSYLSKNDIKNHKGLMFYCRDIDLDGLRDKLNRSITTIDEIYNFEYLSLNVWSLVKGSLHSHLRANTINLDDNAVVKLAINYLLIGSIIIEASQKLFSSERPDVIYLFNGRIAPARIILNLANLYNIRVVVHERGLRSASLQLTENESCLSLKHFSELKNKWENSILFPHEIYRVEDWLIDRSQGRDISWKKFAILNKEKEKEKLFKTDKQKWCIFTSSMDELAGEDEYKSPFGNQFEWIEKTVEFVSDHSDQIELIVRVHPNSSSKVSTGSNHEEVNYFKQLPGRLTIDCVVLQSDDTSFSSYDIMSHIDVGLCYASTVAIELVARGIRCVMAANNPMMFCASIDTVLAQADYRSILTKYLRGETKPKQDLIKYAYRYINGIISKYHIVLPVLKQISPHLNQLVGSNADNFKYGRHKELDRLSNKILGIEPIVENCVRYSSKEMFKIEDDLYREIAKNGISHLKKL
jgi:hypothetical protein